MGDADETKPSKYLEDVRNAFKKQLRKPKFFVEILALLGLAFYTLETHCTNSLTKSALEVSRSQFAQSQISSKKQFDQAQSAAAKQFITDQRPYVWITNDIGPFSIAPHSTGNTSDRLAFNFHYTNYGKSPAINCQTEARIIFGQNAASKISFPPLDSQTGTIVPPGKEAYNTAWSDSPVSPALLARIQTAGVIESVTVTGYIQYSDTSGNVYSSKFCLERNPGPGMAFCKSHNSIR